jgi:hypothetical protein
MYEIKLPKPTFNHYDGIEILFNWYKRKYTNGLYPDKSHIVYDGTGIDLLKGIGVFDRVDFHIKGEKSHYVWI